MGKIGIWGDSITWGGYDKDEGGWATRLRRYHDGNFTFSKTYEGGPSVYNLGVWGDKVADVLKRFDVEYDARRPGVVIIAVGINDSPHQSYLKGTPLDEFETTYRKLVAKANEKAQKVLLVGPTNVADNHPRNRGYRNDVIKRYDAVIERVANEYRLVFVPLFGLMTDDDLSLDGVHPLASGHEKIYLKFKDRIS